MKSMKGRFAPSPSGRMHLGNVAAYLLAWLSAKSAGGSVVLRIEDLDRGRCRREYAEQAALDFETLGLTPDEGGVFAPYMQSGRGKVYAAALETIESRAEVYPCFCTRAELHAASAPHASDGTPVYDGRCRRLSPGEISELMKTRSPALRLAVPDVTVSFEDRRLGHVSQQLAHECGDFVLRRSDGTYAYQLAVVADDIDMGVTEVVRGSDLAMSAPRQIYLCRLLGAEPPEYAHTPMLVAPDGKRLAKRERSLDLGSLLAAARPPRIIGALAYLLGIIDRREDVLPRDLVGEFSWDKITKTDIVINEGTFLHDLSTNQHHFRPVSAQKDT